MGRPADNKSSLVEGPLTPPQSPPLKPLSSSSSSPQLSIEVEADLHIPDNYIQHTLATVPPLPPVEFKNILKEIQWISTLAVTITPLLAIWGAYTTPLRRETAALAVVWYIITGLGITAGYHRLWAHRSYTASKPLEYALAIAGAGAVQGSIKWWSRGHRAHHRYTDTELDPYGAQHGFWHSHVGWTLLKPRRKPGVADVSDLGRNEIVRWQHTWYLELLLSAAFGLPMVIAGLGWGDWKGGLVYAGFVRLVFVQHSTFCVNSLAHWLGEQPFDDRVSPRDHVITAICTLGEGYHNFHHQFPMDYRNAIKWYQYDPTKWFIALCSMVGLATHLQTFPENEIGKGQLTMKLKALRQEQDKWSWPVSTTELPVISWESFQAQSKERALILVSGFIHDVSSFIDEHPGGRHLLTKNIGRDATTAFHGGVYDHSNAAHNLLAMMRVGILHGGLEQEADRAVPPSQRLRIARSTEIAELVRENTVDVSPAGVVSQLGYVSVATH